MTDSQGKVNFTLTQLQAYWLDLCTGRYPVERYFNSDYNIKKLLMAVRSCNEYISLMCYPKFAIIILNTSFPGTGLFETGWNLIYTFLASLFTGFIGS